MSGIDHVTISVAELTLSDREEMFQLMNSYYLGMKREAFERDLAEKDHVMVLRDRKTHCIAGFSTLMRFDLVIPSGKKVKAIFSGDTIVGANERNTFSLGVEITGYFIDTVQEYPKLDIFYILTCKGWRTYRIPGLLFKEFSPTPGKMVERLHQQVMDAFGAKKYPQEYNAKTGIIEHTGNVQRIRPGSSEAIITKRHDLFMEFFAQRNPNHLEGTDLITVSQVAEWNFTPAFEKLLRFRKEGALV